MRWLLAVICFVWLREVPTHPQDLSKPEGSVRIATYNVSLNRKKLGELSTELESGDSKQARGLAEIIQLVRPDVLLLNEIDFDNGKSVRLFAEKYMSVGQNGQQPMTYPYQYTAPVNTGVDSGLDLDHNGITGEPNDAFGFGAFPGQYGMAIYSMYELDIDRIRTFQNFLWKDLPDAALPIDPNSKNRKYYSEQIMQKLRLSSKSHWDVPIRVGNRTIHLLASHPTPPVFDGPEDRNGCRNHDEIRFWADYISNRSDYLYDDRGTKGGLAASRDFVIAGDLNADPVDGDSRENAIQQLLDHDFVDNSFAPKSTGGAFWAERQGMANRDHKGDPATDTGDFDDRRVGNLRVDYVLPSKSLTVVGHGVFWPKPDEPGAEAAKQSDHRLVWIDIEK